MVYARVATGYRPGGPNAQPIAPPPGVPQEYGADKTVNFELGVRSTQLDGRLSIDVAAFHVDWKDIQLFEVVDNIGINANGGKAQIAGRGMDIRLCARAWADPRLDRGLHRRETDLARTGGQRQFRRPAALCAEVEYLHSTANTTGI